MPCSNPRPTRKPGATETRSSRIGFASCSPSSNPRPTRKPGATSLPNANQRGKCASGFQSSPDSEAGRNISAALKRQVQPARFQSSPDSEAGRNAWAKLHPNVRSYCSNPRPTRKPGATFCRKCSRRGLYATRFQSSPDSEAGRNIRTCISTIGTYGGMFQSSPDSEAGRNGFPEWNHCLGSAATVPILARLGSRAQQTLSRLGVFDASALFQSSPDSEAGRNDSHTLYVLTEVAGFQSSPDSEAGRNRLYSVELYPTTGGVVPILARLGSRAQRPLTVI